jgi:hypothetical protein
MALIYTKLRYLLLVIFNPSKFISHPLQTLTNPLYLSKAGVDTNHHLIFAFHIQYFLPALGPIIFVSYWLPVTLFPFPMVARECLIRRQLHCTFRFPEAPGEIRQIRYGKTAALPISYFCTSRAPQLKSSSSCPDQGLFNHTFCRKI